MLSFAQFLDYANALVPGEQRGAVRSRIQHMQRLGFPPDMNSPGDRREWVSYDLDKAMLAGVCIALVDAGMSLPRAVDAVSDHVAIVRKSYAESAAERYAFEDDVRPARSRLLVERGVVDGQSVVRIDALRQDDADSIATVRLSAIFIDVRQLFEVLDENTKGLTDKVVRQAADVLGLTFKERASIERIPVIPIEKSARG